MTGSVAMGGREFESKRVSDADIAQLAESPVKMTRVFGLFRPHWVRFVLLTIIIVVASVVGIAQPFLLRGVIDDALPNKDTALLVWLVIGMVAVAAVTSVLGVIQTWMATAMGQSVMHSLRVKVFDHVQRQSVDFFKRTRGGEIQSRLLQDIAGIQGVITSTATAVASNLTTAVATGVAMVVLDWRLSLVSLVVIPPAAWLTRQVALVRRDITSQRQRLMADLHSQVDEALSVNGAVLISTLGARNRRTAEFAEASAKLVDLDLRSQLAGRWRMATMQIVFAAMPAALYLAAGFPRLAGTISIGTIVAFTALQAQVFRPIMGLLNVGAQWVASMALMSRIFGYLDLPVEVPEPENPVALARSDARGELRVEGVSYHYPDCAAEVLEGIDIHVPPGGSLALVGETGSGKSTLSSLMVRLADPSNGRITLDGIDLRDLTQETLASLIGVVTQETYLAHASVRDNLLIAKPDASDDELWEALCAAQVAEVVKDLPGGLDTIVGARGHRLSGGERQRLAIARTLLVDPAVLVLDEATSSLDNETERELQFALDLLSLGRTTVTIAHRLSTVQNADEIVVLNAGHIVERGTHDDLVALGGTYARLATQPTRWHSSPDVSGYRPRRCESEPVEVGESAAW